MIAIQSKARMLCVDQRGATAIEYGLIAALMAATIAGGIGVLGGGAGGLWGDILTKVSAAI